MIYWVNFESSNDLSAIHQIGQIFLNDLSAICWRILKNRSIFITEPITQRNCYI